MKNVSPTQISNLELPSSDRPAHRSPPGPRAFASSPKTWPAYLHRRSKTFYFKRRIPADVASEFPGSSNQIWKCLNTQLLERAKLMLAVEVTEFELKVASMRRELVRKKVAAKGLVAASSVTKASAVRGACDGVISEHHGDERADLLMRIERDIELLKNMGQNESTGMGWRATPHKLIQKIPVSPSLAPESRSTQRGIIRPTLLHLFEFWKVKQTRARSIQSVRNSVLEFHDLHGSLAVEDITRQHARQWRDHLIEKHLSDITIENRLGFLSTLVRFGQVEIVEHLQSNPFERIPVNGGQSLRVEKDRRAYSTGELNTIFESKLFTKGYRPKGQAAEAAYWAPLIGPFVGGRIEEVAQLRVDDVERINGHWCIRICDIDDEQNVKNIGSYRRVPLHESLIQCGFLAYVARQACAGHQRVFPSLQNDNKNQVWSNALGKWFGRYLDSLGLSDPRLDYHSFRYTFRQQCSLSGIENEVRDALTGHWASHRDAGRTYMRAEEKQYPFPKLVSAIKELRYEELRLQHLHVAEPMAGVDKYLLR